MQKQAEAYLGGLRADHARFSRVLSMLGRDARRLEDEPDKVLHLLEEAVDYIVNYQNIHHHPREEIMFARIAERSATLAKPAARLAKEHQAMGRAGKTMITLLDGVSGGERTRKTREQLAHKLEKFARDMRTHINQEEELLYSQVWTELDEQDWAELAAVEQAVDPLETTESERYPLLTRYVLEGAPRSEVTLRDMTIAQALKSKLEDGSANRGRLRDIRSILARQRREACALSRKSFSALPPLPPLQPGKSIDASMKSTREFGQAYARWWKEWGQWLKGQGH